MSGQDWYDNGGGLICDSRHRGLMTWFAGRAVVVAARDKTVFLTVRRGVDVCGGVGVESAVVAGVQ